MVERQFIYTTVALVWVACLLTQLFWKRKISELNYCWDIRKMEIKPLQTQGKHKIDEITGQISDVREKLRLS